MHGVSINPVAFLVVQNDNVKLMPVDHDSCLDKLLDYVPDLFQKMNQMFNKSIQQKEERNQRIINQMRNRMNTNKTKSEEVKCQEQKVAENEKQAINEQEDFAEADGEDL